MIVHGQEQRTFSTCFSDTSGIILLASLYTKTFDKLQDSSDSLNSIVSNYCNFYHEKTGIWMTHTDWLDQEIKEKYAVEFYQKYKNTYPPELLSLFN